MTTDEILTLAKRELTAKQFDVWKLSAVNGVSSSRIAIMLGVSEPYVRQTVTRATQKIRIAMEEEAA